MELANNPALHDSPERFDCVGVGIANDIRHFMIDGFMIHDDTERPISPISMSPYFWGVWPPKPYIGGSEEQMPISKKQEEERKKQKFEMRCMMAFLAFFGFSLMNNTLGFRDENWIDLFKKIGDALLIAAFLGMTIDIWMKKQIAEDVFEASIGYLIRWHINQLAL